MASPSTHERRTRLNVKGIMREQFIKTVTDIFRDDDKAILILGDIGVWGFRELSEKYPRRVINIGICEQATIGVCAGLAKEGFRPIFYSIAPFAVERCYEQIKIDIGYQNLPVAIVSVGGSYDYASLGCTHHSPADVTLMSTIPHIKIVAPAYNEDVDSNFKLFYGRNPLYMRLSETECNPTADVIAYKRDCVIIAFGNTIENVNKACRTIGIPVVNIIRTDIQKLAPDVFRKIAIIEPWYEGTMHYDVANRYPKAEILSIGVPRKFLTNYGTKEEHDKACGLDVESLRTKLTEFFNG